MNIYIKQGWIKLEKLDVNKPVKDKHISGFDFQTNGEVFDILNFCILNGKFYIHKQKLLHENALDFYDYLCKRKSKLQIERMICNGTSNHEQFSKLLFIYNAL